MSYKDTLTIYEELVASGIPEGQAKILAHQQGALVDVMNGIGFRLDRSLQEMKATLDGVTVTIARHDTTIKLMMTFVVFMAAAFVANILFIKFG